MKKLLLLLFALTLIVSTVNADELYTFSDDFNRANNATVGNNWTQFGSGPTPSISSNQLNINLATGDMGVYREIPNFTTYWEYYLNYTIVSGTSSWWWNLEGNTAKDTGYNTVRSGSWTLRMNTTSLATPSWAVGTSTEYSMKQRRINNTLQYKYWESAGTEPNWTTVTLNGEIDLTTNYFTIRAQGTLQQNYNGVSIEGYNNSGLVLLSKDSMTNNQLFGFTLKLYDSSGSLLNTTNFDKVGTFNSLSTDNYTVVINKTGYQTENVTFYYTGSPLAYEFSLTPAPSVTLNWYDETDNTLITSGNQYALILGDTNSYFLNTSTGTQFQQLGTGADYTIKFWADGYLTKFYDITIESTEAQNISLYLTNASANYDNITATIRNQNLYELEGATLVVEKFNIGLNQYFISERITADFEGKVIFKGTLYEDFYKFKIYYQGELLFGSIPTTIKNTEISFIVTEGEDVGRDYYDSLDLDYSLYFDNTSNRFVFTYSNSVGTITGVKLETHRITSTQDVEVNTTTSSSASSTIYHNINNVTGYKYKSCAYGSLPNGYQLIDCSYKDYADSSPVKSANLMLLFLIFATALMALVGIFSITIGLVITPIPFVIFELAGFTTIGLPYALSLELLFIIIAVIINKT